MNDELIKLLDDVDGRLRQGYALDQRLAYQWLSRLSKELRERLEREQELIQIATTAAEDGCLRGRRVHCAELETDSANWCFPCRAKFWLQQATSMCAMEGCANHKAALGEYCMCCLENAVNASSEWTGNK